MDDVILSAEELGTLPGWIRYPGRDYESSFIGRGEFCRLCRGRAYSFHTQDECHLNSCNICQGKHRTNNCPNNSQSTNAQDGPDSEPEDLHAEHDKPTQSRAQTPEASTSTPSSGPAAPPASLPVTPKTPTRSGPRNHQSATPGASSSATLVDSPGLLHRLSTGPILAKNDKGKGKQLSMENFVVPLPQNPAKRAAPSTAPSAAPLRKRHH